MRLGELRPLLLEPHTQQGSVLSGSITLTHFWALCRSIPNNWRAGQLVHSSWDPLACHPAASCVVPVEPDSRNRTNYQMHKTQTKQRRLICKTIYEEMGPRHPR